MKKLFKLWTAVLVCLLLGSANAVKAANKPNATVNLKSVERVGFHVWLTYLITNNDSEDKSYDLLNPMGTYAYDNEGKKYSVLVKQGDRLFSEYVTVKFPSGIPVKVTVIVGNVPANITSLAKVSIGLATPWDRNPYEQTNVTIKQPDPNSDQPTTILNYPWARIATKACTREQQNIVQAFTVTSPGEKIVIKFERVTAYDEEGNTYEAYFTKGGSLTVEADIPVAGSLTVKNVPANVKKLTAIKADLRINDLRYLMQFNEVTPGSGATAASAPSATASADDRQLFDLKGNVKTCKITYNGATQTYAFSRSGQWTEWNGMDMEMAFPGGITRDAQGRFVEGKRDEYGEYFLKCTYNDKGQLLTMHVCEDMEGGYINTFRRAEDGRVTRIDRRGGFDPNGSPTVQVCSIQLRDSKGNWTKRKRGNVIETRVITYYQ